MNNEQFRNLLLPKEPSKKTSQNGASSSAAPTSAKGSSLGSRQRANIPMTPRSVGGSQADFARQLAERHNATQPQKRFKSFAPRGVKLASGYVDRSKEREEDAEDERAQQLKELEEALKNEEIDQETFEKRRFEIAGGDLSSTHLVKGLDFKLLARIKQGEDVYGDKQPKSEDGDEPEADVDDEFDQLEEQETHAIAKEKEKKKGALSTLSLAPGKKRTRDQILAELKASRQAAKAQPESELGDRFRKIGAKQMPGSRIERDSKGREVLIIVDEDGHEKRKVRKVQPGNEKGDGTTHNGLLMPDKDAKPLGMDVPEQYKRKDEPEEEEDLDIFDGVGDDYDPLAGMNDSDSESEDDDEDKAKKGKDTQGSRTDDETKDKSMPPPPKPQVPHNYFKGSKTGLISEEQSKAPSMSDPAIQAAIKRAAALNPIGKDRSGDDADDAEAEQKKAMEERRKKLLQGTDRDDEDLDMGFGTSRFEDEEDFDDSRVKLSKWGGGGGGGDDDDDTQSRGGKSKRKRGSKKRKGDVNSAADVLRVMEQRKQS
ncbi:hypothetical protein BGZ63DRAFT_480904 [Mariannaea sp. PMI_226]|nr:hypothetical protein BGZ63DRAFT_480904 [Mariannaea sp. PMI_226]